MKSIWIALLLFAIGVPFAAAQTAPQKPKPMCIAVVNFATVLSKYEKALALKSEIDETIRIAGKQTEPLLREIRLERFQLPFAERTPAENRRLLLEFEGRMQRDFGESAENLVGVWQDIHDAAKTYASKHGIDLVIAYSNIVKGDLIDSIDIALLGGTTLLAVSPNVDISQGVADLLNKKASEKSTIKLGTSRFAVVNIRFVYDRSKESIQVRSELEAALNPFKIATKKMIEDQKKYQAAINKGDFSTGTQAELEEKIREIQDSIVESDKKIRIVIGAKLEQNSVQRRDHVKIAVKSQAANDNIDLVLGYADPVAKEALDGLDNVRRKMQMLDQGCAMPLLVSPRTDMGPAVAALWNSRYDKKEPPKSVKADPQPMRVAVLDFASAVRAHPDYAKGSQFLADQPERSLMSQWKDIQTANRTHADKAGIDLILGYAGMASDNSRPTFASVNRKMQTMQQGSTVLLYAAPSAEIGPGVAEGLRK